jgi:hypothetical protein
VNDNFGVMHCYDISPESGGTQSGHEGEEYPNWCTVHKGGPTAVQKKEHRGHTLFLCYPDDFENGAESMAEQTLMRFPGDTVIHAGELWSDTLCKPGAFGRTTAPEAQVVRASEFHCVLKAPLPSWSSSNDTLTVWKRTQTTQIDGNEFGYVPPSEKMVVTAAAPGMKHLL